MTPSRRTRWLFGPGIRLMQALRMTTKLPLVVLSLALPLCGLIAWMLTDQQAQRAVVDAEMQGLAVSTRITETTVEAQKLRGLSHRLRLGDNTAAAPRDDVRRALGAAIDRLDGTLAGTRSYSMDAEWRPLRQSLRTLVQEPAADDAKAGFERHRVAIEALNDLARLNAERSGLLLDPDAPSYFLIETLVGTLPPQLETVALGRGMGAGLIARGSASDFDRSELLAIAGRLQLGTRHIATSIGAYQRSGAAAPESWPAAREAMDRFARLVRDTFTAPDLPAAPAPFSNAGSAAIDAMLVLHGEASARLDELLKARDASLRRGLWVSLGVALLALLVQAYLATVLYLSFRVSLAALGRSTEALSQGDLAHELTMVGGDELAEIGGTVNRMSLHLSTLVAEIRSSAIRVNMAGEQVAEGSQRLSQRTEEQSSSLRHSMLAIGQLGSAMEVNAKAARELDLLSADLSRQAEQGHAAMAETLRAMQVMQESSQRVFEVVSVIDDVAFQTSMLSLNAAVEAARAGESGKGFSVVASEVRQLAQRVGESAEEIRTLTTRAGDQLELSNHKLADAGGALDTLVCGVRDVSARLREISAASTTQSTGLKEIAQRVGDLDQITRDNAGLVEESNAASHGLLQRARILRDAVASMRLRQGSADEARALLGRAFAHIAAVGREQGLADLHRPEAGFIDRDLYVFALDRDGVYVACGARPELVGSSVTSLPGIQGTAFVDDVWSAVAAGGGWVPYEIHHPQTHEVTPKESFVQALDDDLLLGCGIYRSKSGIAPGSPRQDAPVRAREPGPAEAAGPALTHPA